MMLTPQDIDYCPLYCEENIWRLCQHPSFADKPCQVLFISNPTKTCAIWQQRSATSPLHPVVWDYHVVLLVNDGNWLVYDLDSNLALGIDVEIYLQQSFNPPEQGRQSQVSVASQFSPYFKLIDSNTYLEQFNSDRKHMLNSDGSWQSPPPLWPVIIGDEALSLQRLVDMHHGEALSLAELKQTLVSLL